MLSGIDVTSNVAVYIQIENHVQFAVAAGRLKPGDQLPSVREMSERLNVNPNTVAKAYRDLEVMGLLFTRRGMGVFVNRGVEDKCREDVRRRLRERMQEVFKEAKASGMTKEEVDQAIENTLASDVDPYSTPPANVTAIAKVNKQGK